MIIIQPDPRLVVAPTGPVGTPGPPGPAGSGTTIGVKDEGSLVSAVVERINFTGTGVDVSGTGADIVVNIPGGTVVTPQGFGAVGDGVTDDGAAFTDAIDHLNTLAGGSLGYGSATPTLFIPAGTYFLGTTTLSLTNAMCIIGEGAGAIGGQASLLKWSAGVNGFETHANNCYFDGLCLKGPYPTGTASEGEFHAIKGYYRFGYGQLVIIGWQGDGIHVNISAGSGGDTEGNCNALYGDRLTVHHCRNGVSLAGDDENGSYFGFIDAAYCRQAGVLDYSGFGNGYSVIQTATCGVMGLGTPCCSFNNGHIFTVKKDQASGASTNGPPSTATDNTWWLYWKDAGAATSYAPQWTTGQTWRHGGGVVTRDDSNSSTIGHLYVEGDQPPVQCGANTTVGGGLSALGPFTRHVRADGVFGGIRIGPKLLVRGSQTIEPDAFATALTVDGTVKSVDPIIYLKTGNLYTQFQWQSSAGANVADIYANSASGLFINGVLGVKLRFNGSAIADVVTGGIDLASGKVLSVNGTQVVGARQTGTPADATDLATALTLVNALKAKLITHGLIS